MIPSPTKADDPLAGRFGAGPGEQVPLELPLKTKSGPKQENKKAGQMFVATAERTIMFASCFVFCSFPNNKQGRLNREFRKRKQNKQKQITQKQTICDRWRRGAPRPTSSQYTKYRERNVLRQGVRRTTSQTPACACMCERHKRIPLGIQSGHHAKIKCECMRQR